MKRIATGAVGILVMIPICFFSHTVVWSLALTFFSVVAVHEMLSCIGAKGETPFAVPAYLFATMPLVAWLLTVRFPVISSYKLMFIYLAVFLLWEMMAGVIGGNRYPTEKLYSLVALVAYVVVALTAICLIRFINDGASEGAYSDKIKTLPLPSPHYFYGRSFRRRTSPGSRRSKPRSSRCAVS